MTIKQEKYLNDLINGMQNGTIKIATGIRRYYDKIEGV